MLLNYGFKWLLKLRGLKRELAEREYRESSKRALGITSKEASKQAGKQARKQASTWSAFSRSHALEGLVICVNG